MLVKIINNDQESDWFNLTKGQHRAFLKQQPQAVMVHIEELYPDSPDTGQIITLTFAVFTAVARDAMLEENRQNKWAERRCVRNQLDITDPREYRLLTTSPEDELLRAEKREQLFRAWETLTPTQQRRLWLSTQEGLSLQQIADADGVTKNAIDCSIRAAAKKLKKIFLTEPVQNAFFCRIK